VLAPGFDADKSAFAVELTRIMFPFILMVSLAALVMGMLNSRNVFGVPALASSFYNLGSIFGGVTIAWLIDPTFGPRALIGMAIGTLIGGFLQLAVQIPSLKKVGFTFHFDFGWRDEQVKRVRFSDIDAIWKRIAKAPVETAELEQLRERFLALAEAEATPRGERALANSRAEQIALRIEVQKSLLEVAALRNRKNADTKGVADLELAMRTRQPYDIVGRINASAVFNGDRLPLLYRLQDPGTGQTIAYIVPGPGFDLSSMLGLLIGVKGPMRYDDSLRLNTVTPASIDVLGSSPAPQVATPGAAE